MAAAVQAQQWENKQRRYQLRADLRDVMVSQGRIKEAKRVIACGLACSQDGVTLRLSEGPQGRSAGVTGVSTCGSVWLCPVCQAKIAAHRAETIAAVLRWAAREGHTVAFVTLTIRHQLGDPLAALWEALTAGWRKVKSGSLWHGDTKAQWKAKQDRWHNRKKDRPYPTRRIGIREKWGLLGGFTATEVTHGQHGWHPHLHIIMIFEGETSQESVEAFCAKWWQTYEDVIVKDHGYDVIKDSGGFDLKMGTAATDRLADYLMKQLAFEAVSGHSKAGRTKTSRTPSQILQDVVKNGDAEDVELWVEYVKASHGRQQLRPFGQVMELSGVKDDESDEEIAAADHDGEALLTIPSDDFNRIAGKLGYLLVAAERDGVQGAIRWLTDRRIPFELNPNWTGQTTPQDDDLL